MKNQALFSSKDKSKKLKCCLLQFLFDALRVTNLFIELMAITTFYRQTVTECLLHSINSSIKSDDFSSIITASEEFIPI